mgnify:CR=1 FL=1
MGVCAEVLEQCDRAFLAWYDKLYPRTSATKRTTFRMQSFVTRYRPRPLKRHRHTRGN